MKAFDDYYKENIDKITKEGWSVEDVWEDYEEYLKYEYKEFYNKQKTRKDELTGKARG